MDYYVRCKQGAFRDDRFRFDTDWTKVPDGFGLGSVHLENPNLEVLDADVYAKASKGQKAGGAPEPAPEPASSKAGGAPEPAPEGE